MKRTSVRIKEQWETKEGAADSVLNVFLWFPELEFTLTEVAKYAQVSKSTAHRITYDLSKRGLVTIEDKKIILRIKANRTDFRFINEKILHNLKDIYESRLVDFLIEKFKNPKAIILFGSFRKGEDISTSDIDIAIETSEDIDIETFDITDQFTEWAHKDWKLFFKLRKIQILKFNRGRIDINLFNNVANGFVLYGFLEVKP